MAKVVLKSLEGGPKAVVIPTGKTVIGRGPLLGCGDKKVSRKHAVLEVTESGEIYLTPIHVNPCFYQPTLEKTAKVLKKDTAQKLEPGDTFSLLPRAFRYQVAMDDCQKNEEQENKVQNNKESEPDKENIAEGIKTELEEKFVEDTEAEKVEMEKTVDSPEGESEDEEDENDSNAIKQETEVAQINGEKLCTETNVTVDNNMVHTETAKEEPKATQVVPEIQQNTTNHSEEKISEKKPIVRKRTLPEWLIKCAASPPPAQSAEQQKVTKRKIVAASSAVSTGTKPKKQTSKRRMYSDSESEKEIRRPSKARSSRQNRQTRQGISLEDFIVSDDDEWDSDESRNQRSRRKRGQKRDEDSGSDWEAEQRKKRRSSYRMDSGSDSASDWETENRKKKLSKKPARRGKARYTKDVSEDDDDEPSASAKKNRRPCTYGKECYRKKPSHFEEFSHPGDSDYNSEVETNHSEEDEEGNNSEDGRPECPYGIDCYRKNAKHRKDYKHTKKVRPKREAAKKAGKRRGDDEEGDSNMNDVDEEESDIYDPQESASDWEPEVDSDGDDVKRLLKEPKGFVQNKTQKQV